MNGFCKAPALDAWERLDQALGLQVTCTAGVRRDLRTAPENRHAIHNFSAGPALQPGALLSAAFPEICPQLAASPADGGGELCSVEALRTLGVV